MLDICCLIVHLIRCVASSSLFLALPPPTAPTLRPSLTPQEMAGLLARLKAGGHKCLIFTQMSKMLDVLEVGASLYATFFTFGWPSRFLSLLYVQRSLHDMHAHELHAGG